MKYWLCSFGLISSVSIVSAEFQKHIPDVHKMGELLSKVSSISSVVSILEKSETVRTIGTSLIKASYSFEDQSGFCEINIDASSKKWLSISVYNSSHVPIWTVRSPLMGESFFKFQINKSEHDKSFSKMDEFFINAEGTCLFSSVIKKITLTTQNAIGTVAADTYEIEYQEKHNIKGNLTFKSEKNLKTLEKHEFHFDANGKVFKSGFCDSSGHLEYLNAATGGETPKPLASLGKFESSTPKKKEIKTTNDKKIELLSVDQIKTLLDKKIVGHEDEKMFLAVEGFKHLERIHRIQAGEELETKASHALFVGPSGCGKTFLLEILSSVLNVAFVVIDITKVTPTGISGDSIQSIIEERLKDQPNPEFALIFLDEIDKRSLRKDLGTEAILLADGVQNEMLTLMNGTINNYWFVAGGAFAFEKEGDVSKIVRANLKPELIGRFSSIFSLKSAFTAKDFRKLFSEDANGLTRILDYHRNKGATIVLPDSVEQDIAEYYLAWCKKNETGIRGSFNQIKSKLSSRFEFALLSNNPETSFKNKKITIKDARFFTSDELAEDRIKKYLKFEKL